MHKAILSLLGVAILVGCGSKPDSPTPRSGDGQRVQIRIGDLEDSGRGYMLLKITAIREKQQPSEGAPFHKDGGDWTFLDCEAAADPNVVFTVGIKTKAGSGSGPFTWGQAMMIVNDRAAGGRFLSLFEKSFPGTLPSPTDRAYEPQPLTISTAILGEDLAREPEGGFFGAGGGWTATKWFPEFDGRSGEIYFNYNLGAGEAEFSEKDADYADDLLAVFAEALRDGPPPERTPDNDPNLTLIGPKIGLPRKLLPERSYDHSISPGNKFVVYVSDSTILAVPLDEVNSEPFEVAKFDYPPVIVRVLNDTLDLLVQEAMPETPGTHSSSDPMRIWLLEGSGHKRTLLRAPEKHIGIAEAAASADLRYFAFDQWQGEPGTDDRTKVLFILDRTTGNEQTFRIRGEGLTLIDWRQSGDGFQGVAVTNRWPWENEGSELYIADPSSGALERQADVDALFELANLWSPNKTRRVRVDGHDLVVTDVASGKLSRFTFHEDDWPFIIEECVEWAGPQYVKFNGRRLSLIDVTALKMCFPEFDHEGEFDPHSFKFSTDMRWVLYQGDGIDGPGLFLAPVEMPTEQ